jgi:hypothetical protein
MTGQHEMNFNKYSWSGLSINTVFYLSLHYLFFGPKDGTGNEVTGFGPRKEKRKVDSVYAHKFILMGPLIKETIIRKELMDPSNE